MLNYLSQNLGMGMGIIALVLLGSLIIWMFIHSIRRGEYLWTFFIIIFAGLGALLYFFLVYRGSGERGVMYSCFQVFLLLVAMLILGLIGLGVWIVADGSSDEGAGADVALIFWGEPRQDGTQEQHVHMCLDAAVKFYRERRFPLIVVSGRTRSDGSDEAKMMAQYLVTRGVPFAAIVMDPTGGRDQVTAQTVAKVMKDRNLRSVMIISDYYRLTRMRLALQHEDILTVSHVHIGNPNKDDGILALREAWLTCHDFVINIFIPDFNQFWSKQRDAGLKQF